MGKKDKSDGNGNGNAHSGTEVELLKHEVKRLVRLRRYIDWRNRNKARGVPKNAQIIRTRFRRNQTRSTASVSQK